MLELRRAVGWDATTRQTSVCGYDELVLDGVVIGVSMVGANEIHWQPYPKKDIPKSVRSNAVKLCQERNAKERLV